MLVVPHFRIFVTEVRLPIYYPNAFWGFAVAMQSITLIPIGVGETGRQWGSKTAERGVGSYKIGENPRGRENVYLVYINSFHSTCIRKPCSQVS